MGYNEQIDVEIEELRQELHLYLAQQGVELNE